MAASKKFSIENAMKRLDEISILMSKDDVTLEESFKLYNEGVKLVKDCKGLLVGVEKELTILEEGEKEEKNG